MRILVAEDDNVSCKALEDSLREWGYDVVTAGENFLRASKMELIQASDNALLSAKKKGRDRIILYKFT